MSIIVSLEPWCLVTIIIPHHHATPHFPLEGRQQGGVAASRQSGRDFNVLQQGRISLVSTHIFCVERVKFGFRVRASSFFISKMPLADASI